MMKTTALITLISIVLTSCDFQNDRTENPITEKNSIETQIKKVPINKIEAIVYDGCEYIIYKEDEDQNSAYGFMAHKGNCSNPIHEHNRQKE